MGETCSRWLGKRWRAVRAFSFPLSVLPVLIATAAVSVGGAGGSGPILAASLAGVILLHGAGNLLNDYFDFLHGVDRRTHGDEGRPGRLLVRGELEPGDVLAEALFFLALLVPVAWWLVRLRGWPIIAFGVAAGIAIFGYTGPPFRFKYRALGEAVIFLFFGPVLMAGAAFAQTGSWSPSVLALSVPVGLASACVLFANNLRDRDEDGRAGILTLALVLGPEAGRALFVFLLLAPPLAVTLLPLTGLAPPGAAAGFLALVPAASLYRDTARGRRLPDVDRRAAKGTAVLLASVLVGVVVGMG